MATLEMTIPTTPAENKAILHRWCGEVFNGKHVDVVDELKVPNYADWSRFPGQAPTLEAYKLTLGMFFAAFPDFQFGVQDTLASGDLGLIRGTWRGTHTGSFMGIPPTGKEVGGERIDFFRFADRKMSEHWGTGMELSVLKLLGFDPAVPAPAPSEGKLGVARAFIDHVLVRHNLVALRELYAGMAGNLAGQAAEMLLLQTAFPDAQVTVEHVLEDGDRIAVHSTLTGEHLGGYLGVGPTGRPVEVTKVDIFRLAGDKIVESWHQWDNVSLLLQIGAIQGPDAPPRTGPVLHA